MSGTIKFQRPPLPEPIKYIPGPCMGKKYIVLLSFEDEGPWYKSIQDIYVPELLYDRGQFKERWRWSKRVASYTRSTVPSTGKLCVCTMCKREKRKRRRDKILMKEKTL